MAMDGSRKYVRCAAMYAQLICAAISAIVDTLRDIALYHNVVTAKHVSCVVAIVMYISADMLSCLQRSMRSLPEAAKHRLH